METSAEIGERKFVTEKEVQKKKDQLPGMRKEQPEQHKEQKKKESKTEKTKEKAKDLRDGENVLKKQEEKTRHRRVERGEFLEAAAQSMEGAAIHDMRDQALGRMSAVGASVDYDELGRMAKNRIRDADELVNESLSNRGFESDVERIQQMMDGYVHSGKPDINTIASLEREYGRDEIAQAYVNVAKNSSREDLRRLERIDDVCGFDSLGYERAFDRIRRYDREADAVLDRLDMEFGLERS